MKIKLIFLVFITLIPSACYADRVNNELREIVNNLLVSDGVDVIAYQDDRYIVSIADADIKSNTPLDKLNAMKIARQLSEAQISRFINGEFVYIKEKLESIRVVKSSMNESQYIKNKDIYEEFITSKSSGMMRNMINIKWVHDHAYFVATLMKI